MLSWISGEVKFNLPYLNWYAVGFYVLWLLYTRIHKWELRVFRMRRSLTEVLCRDRCWHVKYSKLVQPLRIRSKAVVLHVNAKQNNKKLYHEIIKFHQHEIFLGFNDTLFEKLETAGKCMMFHCTESISSNLHHDKTVEDWQIRKTGHTTSQQNYGRLVIHKIWPKSIRIFHFTLNCSRNTTNKCHNNYDMY